MPSADLYEGRSSFEPLKDTWEIAKRGVGAWIDAQYYEAVGGTTTGQRVEKGGAGGPTFDTGNGQVRTTAQQTGTAVASNGIAGIPATTLLLFGALGVAAYVLVK